MTAAADSTIFLFGGVHLVMWWNFVARTPEEGAEQLVGGPAEVQHGERIQG